MIGKRFIFLHEVDSTNNYAAKLLSEGNLSHGTVILAEKQTSGRGQRGNTWVTTAANQFTASYYLETAFLSVEHLVYFNMAVALSVQQAISQFVPPKSWIKWPNDVLVSNKKIAGILIETNMKNGKVAGAIVGIGINLHTESNIEKAIAMDHFQTSPPEPLSIIDALNRSLTYWYGKLVAQNFQAVKEAYLSELWNYAVPIAAQLTDGAMIFGKITDVNAIGNLVFETTSKTFEFGIQEVKFTY